MDDSEEASSRNETVSRPKDAHGRPLPRPRKNTEALEATQNAVGASHNTGTAAAVTPANTPAESHTGESSVRSGNTNEDVDIEIVGVKPVLKVTPATTQANATSSTSHAESRKAPAAKRSGISAILVDDDSDSDDGQGPIFLAEDLGEDEIDVDEKPKKATKDKGKGKAKAEGEKAPRKTKAKAEAPAKDVKEKDVRVKLKGTAVNEAHLKAQVAKDAQAAAEAFLGMAYVSLSSKQPFKLNFASVNARDLSMFKVRGVMDSFKNHSIMPWMDPMPIVVEEGFVNLATLTKQFINTLDGPRAEWLPGCHNKYVVFLNGQHRREALRLRAAGLTDDQELTDRRIEKLLQANRDEDQKREGLEILNITRDNIKAVSEDNMIWLCRFYDAAKIGKNQSVLMYLSKNDRTVSYAPTNEETLQWDHFAIRMAAQEYRRTHPHLTVGSDEWRNAIVVPQVGEQAQKKGVTALFCSAWIYNFLNSVFRLNYIGDGNTLKVKDLQERLTRKKIAPTSITTNRIHNTVGGMWGSVLEALVEDMIFVSTPGSWPRIDQKRPAEDEDKHGHLYTVWCYARMWRKGPPSIDEYWKAVAFLAEAKGSLLDTSTNQQHEIWHPTLMKHLDALYVKHVRPVKAYFGVKSHDDWAERMARYWEHAMKTCIAWWSSEPHGPSTEATTNAQTNALSKLIWIGFLRKSNQAFDLPWPTRSMLDDMYTTLHNASFGIQYISRMSDPTVDRAMYMSVSDIWDHTSHMREYFKDPQIMDTSADFPRHLWQWIFDHLVELTEMDLYVSKNTTVEMTRFYNLNLNMLKKVGHSITLGSDAFAVESESWKGIFGEDGWQPSYSVDVQAIAQILQDNSPRPVRVKKLVTKVPPRPERALCGPIPATPVAKYESLRLLLHTTTLEWRCFDASDRLKDVLGFAAHIFIAHMLYVQSARLNLQTEVGAKLRVDYLKFLQDNWRVRKSRNEFTIKIAPTRVAWDNPIIERISSGAPPPPKKKVGAVPLHLRVAAGERWSKYCLDIKRIVSSVLAASVSMANRSENSLANENVAIKLGELVDAMTRNANVQEFRIANGVTAPYVEPTTTLTLIAHPPIRSSPDPHRFTSLDDFQLRDPERFAEFHMRRQAHHLALVMQKKLDPKILVPELESILPQHLPEVSSTFKAKVEDQDQDPAAALAREASRKVGHDFFSKFDDDDNNKTDPIAGPSKTSADSMKSSIVSLMNRSVDDSSESEYDDPVGPSLVARASAPVTRSTCNTSSDALPVSNIEIIDDSVAADSPAKDHLAESTREDSNNVSESEILTEDGSVDDSPQAPVHITLPPKKIRSHEVYLSLGASSIAEKDLHLDEKMFKDLPELTLVWFDDKDARNKVFLLESLKDVDEMNPTSFDYALAMMTYPYIEDTYAAVRTLPPVGLAEEFHNAYYVELALRFEDAETSPTLPPGPKLIAGHLLWQAISYPQRLYKGGKFPRLPDTQLTALSVPGTPSHSQPRAVTSRSPTPTPNTPPPQQPRTVTPASQMSTPTMPPPQHLHIVTEELPPSSGSAPSTPEVPCPQQPGHESVDVAMEEPLSSQASDVNMEIDSMQTTDIGRILVPASPPLSAFSFEDPTSTPTPAQGPARHAHSTAAKRVFEDISPPSAAASKRARTGSLGASKRVASTSAAEAGPSTRATTTSRRATSTPGAGASGASSRAHSRGPSTRATVAKGKAKFGMLSDMTEEAQEAEDDADARALAKFTASKAV